MAFQIESPENTYVIEKIWAVCSEDSEGRHGIVAHVDPFIGLTPVVSANKDHLEHMVKLGRDIAQQHRRKIVLMEFDRVKVTRLE